MKLQTEFKQAGIWFRNQATTPQPYSYYKIFNGHKNKFCVSPLFCNSLPSSRLLLCPRTTTVHQKKEVFCSLFLYRRLEITMQRNEVTWRLQNRSLAELRMKLSSPSAHAPTTLCTWQDTASNPSFLNFHSKEAVLLVYCLTFFGFASNWTCHALTYCMLTATLRGLVLRWVGATETKF